MQTLEPSRRPLADLKLLKLPWCKIYLFRPTSGFLLLWLTLLIRTHQRMRDYKECLQQNLPTNIFSSLVVSKISKHESCKFVLWKISAWLRLGSVMVFYATHVRLFHLYVSRWNAFVKQADPGIGRIIFSSNFMKPWLPIPMRPKWLCHVSDFVLINSLWAHSTEWVSAALPWEDQTWSRTWRTCPKVFDLPIYRHIWKVWRFVEDGLPIRCCDLLELNLSF